MSVNATTREDYYWKKFGPSLSRPSFTEPQEGIISIETQARDTTGIELNTDSIARKEVIDSLQNCYPYIIPQEKSNAATPTADYISNWQNYPDFNENSPHQTIKTYSIKEMYPGENGILIPQRIQTEIWFTPLLFLIFLIYGLIFSRKKKFLLQDLKEFCSLSLRSESYRDDSFSDNSRSKILSMIAGIINISLFSFFATSRFLNHETENFSFVLPLVLVITILFILFKIATIKVICYVFFDKIRSSAWSKTFQSFILFFGIALIPSVLCLSFGPTSWITPVIYTGLFAYICLSILYLSKITTFFYKSTSSLFYLILYLCTLEILPTFIFLGGLINVITNNGIIVR